VTLYVLLLLVSAFASDEPWDELLDDHDWEPRAERETAVGTVTVSRRDIEGLWCLRAQAHTDTPPDELMRVVWDIASVGRWSSNELTASEVIEPGADRMVFWQHMDLPGWLFMNDRYWLLRAEATTGEGVAAMRWRRVDAEAGHPDVVRRAQAIDTRAMQPPIMWGEWRFSVESGHTVVEWRGCQDVGGRIPRWLQTWGATRSLPVAVEDLIVEAQRRSDGASRPPFVAH